MPSAVTVAPSFSALPPFGTSCGLLTPEIGRLGDDAGGVTAGSCFDVGDSICEGNEEGECRLSVEVVLSMRWLIPFQVKTQRRAHRPGSTETEHDATAIGKADADPLLCAY